MDKWLLRVLREKRRLWTAQETQLEARGNRLLLEAMKRPTVSLTAETEFLMMALSLALTRRKKAMAQKLVRRLESRTR